jgi:hypothetical protein
MEPIIELTACILTGFIGYLIGDWKGERKVIQVVLDNTFPPVLPFNAGLISRALYNWRLNDWTRWKEVRERVFRENLASSNSVIDHLKQKEELEALLLNNRDTRVEIMQSEHDLKRGIDEKITETTDR